MFNIIDFFKKLFSREKENEEWKDGCLPDPVDYRDVALGAVKEFVKLPETYRIPYVLRISQQGLNPYCVGFSTATAKEEKERREQNFMDFDGEWIYRECKKIDGIPNVRGTFFRAGLKVLQKTGARPLEGGDISKYRIGGYVKVLSDFESIKQAIYEYGIVLAGFRGSNQGWKTAYIRPPKAGERIWGHAVALIGWNQTHIIGQNSWGKGWGDKGYFYIPRTYLPFSCWVILTDLPNNWKELLDPGKEKPKYNFKNNLFYGLRNNEVKILQDCLKWIGCFSPEIESTGNFYKITLEAVKCFQTRYNIRPISGYVGPLTRSKLNELFA